MRSRGVDNDPSSGRRDVSRRDLLRLRPQPAVPAEQTQHSYDLLKATRSAMGSYFEIRLPFGLPGAAELATRALDRVDELEAQLTVYQDESEVSRLNALGADQPVFVEAGLFQLLSQAVTLSQLTHGAYDITSGALSMAWGFTRGPKRVPDEATLVQARQRTGWQYLQLDSAAQTVAFNVPGLSINLGSIGKGYAIDQAVKIIADYWLPTSALVHGGRSSLYALGSPPDLFGGRWDIAVHNPLDPDLPLGTMHLRNRAMGTSGASFQQFENKGRFYGHIIDPRTGYPPESGPLSVSVLAPSAAEADALSTAFYLIGIEEASKIVRTRPELAALFVLPGELGPPKLVTMGMTPADFTPAAR